MAAIVHRPILYNLIFPRYEDHAAAGETRRLEAAEGGERIGVQAHGNRRGKKEKKLIKRHGSKQEHTLRE